MKYDKRKPWTKVYERVFGPLMALAVLVAAGVAVLNWIKSMK